MARRNRSHAIGYRFTHISYRTTPLRLLALLLAGFCTAFASPAQALNTVANIDAVRERGQSVPPFLNPGVKANLLLLIDNSGSMLDMAYTDETTTGTCFDDSYSSTPTDPYAGYYESNSWYKWHDSSIQKWQANKLYNAGDIVIDNGILFKASCSSGTSCTSSTVDNIDDDTGVIWSSATGGTKWIAGTSYASGSFVKYKGQLYYLNTTPPDLYQSIDTPDTDSKWVPMDSTWRAGTAYSQGDIVTYNGMVFKAKSDTAGKPAFDWSDWDRLDEGYFEEVAAAPCASPSYTHSYTDSTGQPETDFQITMVDASGNKITDSTTQTAAAVTCFAARGNFLNWSSASKFDIEKKILTGGKYSAGYEDSDPNVTTDSSDDRLISENRGCAGTGFIKQIPVSNGTSTHSLTLRIRGAAGDNPWVVQTEDRVDTTDYTARIEILSVSASGFNNQLCIDAADAISTAPSGATAKDEISACMGYDELDKTGTQNATFINGLIECTQIWKGTGSAAAVNNLESHCSKLYGDGVSPIGITPWDPEYLCYGSYNPYLATVEERDGFFGACWGLPVGSGPCTKPATCSYTADTQSGTTWHRCRTDGIEYECNGTYQAKGNSYVCSTSGNNDNGWGPLYKDDTGNYCEYNSGSSTVTTAGWVDDPADCTLKAAQKFCGQLKVPEVIDPSDKSTTTTESYNLPAMLIDSGVMGQLNITRPLAVMKGFIKVAEAPTGVLQKKASELMIGAMKLNTVGADYECSEASSGNIEKYCPAQNADGAKLIAPLKLGKATDNGRTHVDIVAEAINDVKANTWTPLAEAVYSALGYFTQRADLCLNEDNSGNCLDFPISAADDPVQQSCQPNHLLIITEGASTTDIDSQVTAFATAHYDGSGGDTTAVLGTCTDGLQGSTFLDDLSAFGYYDKPTRQEYTTDADFEAAYDAAEIEAINLYTSSKAYVDGDIKESVVTHIITTGSLRDEGLGECNPATLLTNAASQGGSTGYVSGENPADFEGGLNFIFESILSRASAGSAASVISSSRSGEGAVYQAIFWPELSREDGAGTQWSVSWAGEVHSLFIDSSGYLYEDTNGDGRLDPVKDLDGDTVRDTTNEDIDGDYWLDEKEDATTGDLDCDSKVDVDEDLDDDGNLDVVEKAWTSGNEGTDKRVIIYFDSTFNKSMGCYKFEYEAVNGDTCTKALTCTDPVPLESIKYIWSANDWLANIPNNDASLLSNRSDVTDDSGAGYISATHQRNIFTWNDKNNNGVVDYINGEIISFEPATDWDIAVSAGRGTIAKDFGLMADSEVDALVSWMRGKDNPGVFRERQIPDADGSSTMQYWRLGDVIHSTPMTVGPPEENYNLIYNDGSYADFAAKYNNRRNVIYFGANDGMLHAVNGGFFNDDKMMFCRTQACALDSTTLIETNTVSTPELGAELWAYVPYNLQPHLEFLADPDYVHKYYVDLRPRIFDAQIFPDDGDHPKGWGTILVGGMRFGGAPVHAEELNGLTTDNRVFASSYFVFDITNPEKPPVLLGEVTRTSEDVNFDKTLAAIEDDDGDSTMDSQGTDMGYSTAIPTMVIMKEGGAAVSDVNGKNRWYLMLGSGPHSYYTATDSTGSRALKGFSDQNAKVAVLPLQRLFDSSAPIRIPDAPPTEAAGGRYDLTGSPRGFVSDLITVDFDIAPSSADYMADAVYFGTVEANVDDASGGFSFAADGSAEWYGGGKLYRLRTRNLSGAESFSYFVQKTQRPFITGSTLAQVRQNITTPDDWAPTILMDPGRPITGSPSVAYDNRNFWVYFGTGRFFDADDKTDTTQQAYYGIKEPMQDVTLTVTVDGTDTTYNIFKFTWDEVESLWTSNTPGSKGLLQVDEILVHEATSGYTAELSCRDNTTGLEGVGTSCLPTEIVSAAGTAFFDSVNGPSLLKYIAGKGACTSTDNYGNCVDGWYKEFYDYGNRERNLGQATILGGLVTFTTYQPYSEPCLAEGISYLYGVYYQTGTAWYENVFGQNGLDADSNVKDKLELGRGLSTTPNLHVGSDEDGAKAFIQTSTGEIKEVDQENLPLNNYKTGMDSWKEYEK